MNIKKRVRTHKEGEGSSKSVHHAYKWEGVDTCKYVRKKSLFACILLYFYILYLHFVISLYVLLSYFVVFVDNFHYCFLKHML